MSPAPDRSFVFNLVWNGTVFTYLRYFVASQVAMSDARFRFVVNGCPAEQVALMERFAAAHPDRVVEILDVSDRADEGVRVVGDTVRHGDALDLVRATRDDGEFFCFIDPDILARAPFVPLFAAELDGRCEGVTSGRGVWCDSDVIPEGHPGVSGEYFYSQEGYLFGSPHFAMYRRSALDDTIERWGVGFSSAGNDISDDAKKQLLAAGHDHWLYDTGKIVNILFQEDGHVLHHVEHPDLMHIGGMSHYLSPPKFVKGADGGDPEPDWSRWKGMASRFEVARFTAAVLRDLCEGRTPPAVPEGLEPSMGARLADVRSRLVDLVGTYDPIVEGA